MLRALAAAGVAASAPSLVRRWATVLGERADRPNHRGQSVSLAAGPAAATALTGAFLVTGQLGAAVAAAGAGAVGAYDDLAEAGPPTKGLEGHARALAQGRVTTGAAKVVGLGVVGLASAALSRSRHSRSGLLRDAALVAGTANLLNLFDLRPGRALKVAGLLSVPLGARPVQGVVAGLLPGDLGERTMLGDSGANTLGAALGAVAVGRLPAGVRLVALGGVVGLTLASERVSFSAWIDEHAWARNLDGLGRQA